ncbi:MAG: glutamine amidotransferase family protein [Oscillospiraceae bacterium]|jgi:glutamate synthase domain-containing protein 1|nr:glutamine amidotransferase family protein [Oscillospiraceae bacterium]
MNNFSTAITTGNAALEGAFRNPSGCAISGIFSKNGKLMSGNAIIESIEIMHERSNGLGGGFAAYGIYPEHKHEYALHIFHNSIGSKIETEKYLEETFEVSAASTIPIQPVPGIDQGPLIWRYFATPRRDKLRDSQQDEREFTARAVFHINRDIDGSFVFSSGKNMGVFKAVGYPEDVGRFYRLSEYEGYCFTAHGRYPTNTPGWWGGAHPFSLLDTTVVHNGEISSYDANRRSIEMYGYPCTLQTDTEVIAYIIDYLTRRQGLTFEEVCRVTAAPFWSEIEKMPADERREYEFLRTVFSPYLITGPFSILVGFTGGMMALNDRLKLRSMVAAEKGDLLYCASEESAIRLIEPDLDKVWAPSGGECVIARLTPDAHKKIYG